MTTSTPSGIIKVQTNKEETTMKELARKMVEYWGTVVLDCLWLVNAIDNYCYAHNIELTEEEECEVYEIIMDDEY